MEKNRLGGRLMAVLGALIIILGTAHLGFAISVYNEEYRDLADGMGPVFLYMYIGAGLAVILSGSVIAFSSRGLIKSEYWARFPAFISGLIICIMGLMAVFMMPSNPFSYLALVLGLLPIVLLLIYRQEFKSPKFK